jgi:hypothetical protein
MNHRTGLKSYVTSVEKLCGKTVETKEETVRSCILLEWYVSMMLMSYGTASI